MRKENNSTAREFNLEKAAHWFSSQSGKVKFAVIIGRHTKIYPEKYKEDASTTIIIDDYENLEDLKAANN